MKMVTLKILKHKHFIAKLSVFCTRVMVLTLPVHRGPIIVKRHTLVALLTSVLVFSVSLLG